MTERESSSESVEEALASCALLVTLTRELNDYEQPILSMEDALIKKTGELEELCSEKRILQAEREQALRKLLSIQNDLGDITAMERRVRLDTQKIEGDIQNRRADEEYLKLRERIMELRRKHDLPELGHLPTHQDEENARYLQGRLNDRRRRASPSNGTS